jgi:D-cysteine desulfhydrase
VTITAPAAFPLFERFPKLVRRTPRVELGHQPSPVSQLSALSHSLGTEVWLKNDGVYGALYGGNKTRKLEFVLGDALRRGARAILTTGGIGTNHGLATAIYARRAGLRVGLLLGYEEPTAEAVANLLRMAETGAEIHYTHSYPMTAILAPYFVAREALRGRRMPYLLGPGGSSAIASLGYVNAAFELAQQIRSGELPEPQTAVIPLGTGGTVAGLLAGLRMAGLKTQVVAVSVTHAPTTWQPLVARLARATAQLVARRSGEQEIGHLRLEGLTIERAWIGRGLGQATRAGEAATNVLRDLEGVDLDAVYTAKSMAALIGLAKAHRVSGPVLFWQTHNSIPLPLPGPGSRDRLPAALRRVCGL